MNEGKPTKPAKAKWWSRPRPQVPEAGDAPAAVPVPDDNEVDFEPARPAPPADGDFELEAPSRPDPEHDAGFPGQGVEERVDTPAALDAPRLDAAPGTAAPEPGAPAVPSATDRPRPLHDPDPYSTPPYGKPGPWAPAPPVQHPAATPAHGTTLPTPAPGPPHASHGSPVPAPATPVPHDAPLPPPAEQAVTPHPDPWHRYDPWSAAQASAHAPLQQNGAAVPTQQQRRKRARRALVGGALVLALVSGAAGGAVGAYLERNGGVGGIQLPQTGKVPAGRAPDSVAGIAARALPSVVTLHVTGSNEQGTGTGFVLDTRGHILTNNHVVEFAASGGEISVTFSSGDTAKARIVGRDTGYDLAVVQVTGVHGLKPLSLGNSDNVQVGDPVVAIGAPFDLANTVTSGIISAKERPITAGGESEDGSDVSYVDALQTDAPINPGNSGGPLLDSQAHVIGINSAIRSADSASGSGDGQAGSIGLGFAIPVNQARRVAEELINKGKATHPVIGITLDMGYTGDGARIGVKGAKGSPAVATGGPGDRAGLRSGDVITEVDGQPVHSGEELIVKTRAHRPGDRLRLTVERDGGHRSVALVLGSSDHS
ncbi:S1C family serine protease [Streptomyces sp. HUAS TT20]|uniref:S1C family serine protease n=1 Tax=Streptomyces sp. HUAS TT20 TaxID=3447509 RepID=UPI0021D85D99|nr:trypsin-like peptidase domain-containing protein [Streptomyces sp. HUAS 15-9]UXY29742.1 trypsin-like peptidase domain-containing protein [Streptomyces sp. HUAS 15-9]